MKKLIMVISVLGILFVGCGDKEQLIDNGGIEPGSNQVEIAEDEVVVEKKEYDMIGEIIEFRENEIHVLGGDVVEVYSVKNEVLSNFYLGETVGLTLNGDVYDVEPYIIKDFTRRFTTMGDRIESITGEVTISSSDSITIESELEELVFDIDEPVFAEIGNIITVDYLQIGEEKYILEIYNETNKFTTTVIAISRGEDGSFVVSLGEGTEITHIGTLNNSVINFNMSELKVGDELDIYVEIMAMSYPAQMAPKKAIRTKTN